MIYTIVEKNKFLKSNCINFYSDEYGNFSDFPTIFKELATARLACKKLNKVFKGTYELEVRIIEVDVRFGDAV